MSEGIQSFNTIIVNERSAWLVVSIIFIVMFVLMICVNIYLYALRRQSLHYIQDSHRMYQQMLKDREQLKLDVGGHHDQHEQHQAYGFQTVA